MAEDQMVGRKMEGSFDLLATSDELNIVYLRPVSVSWRSGFEALLWQCVSSP